MLSTLWQSKIKLGLALWAALTLLGWLWYLPFLSGVPLPGVHGLAWAYSALVIIMILVLLTVFLTLPLVGLAFIALLLASLRPEWQRPARRRGKNLLVLLLIELLALIALLPTMILGYYPQTQQTIAPWQQSFHAIYVPPLDDNYGALLLLRCDRWKLCYSVYRGETNVMSAAEARLHYNAETERVALRLESQWVYVQSATGEVCRMPSRAFNAETRCNFEP
ncbi:MAG: hypothetical protein AAF773_27560 [Cyanobacteria bacterium P01_D01_bin.115]